MGSRKEIHKVPAKATRAKAPKEAKLISLDIACGQVKEEGWVGVDIVKTTGVDVVHDLLKFPWPFADGSVGLAKCSHFFEHVPNHLRFKFMDELYRIMAKGAQCTFFVPYYASMRAVQDPTHEWPPIAESSFLYFNAEWRRNSKLDHYPVKCDFDFTYSYALDNSPPFNLGGRNQDFQMTAIKHYINSVTDLIVTVTKR